MLLSVSRVLNLGAFAFLLWPTSTSGAITPVNPVWAKLQAKRPSYNKRQGPSFPQYTFTQPLDHFSDTGSTFQQRYWVNDRYYQPDGPVIVFEAGEGPGDERMPILDTGIVSILAKATNGLAIVLEHRYYGESVPVQNFTTDSLRWLSNEQAAADSANFLANVTIPSINADLTAPGTPWIYYGGSYGGARAAHMRILYPDLVYAAIGSSAVTHATVVDWRYFDLVRQYAGDDCMAQVETAVKEVDAFLENGRTSEAIKTVFGLQGLTYDPDFASMLTSPLGGWQNTNWDPAVSSKTLARFCTALGTPTKNTVKTMEGLTLNNATFNYAQYINQTYASTCPPAQQNECYGSITNPDFYLQTDLSQTWRLWLFQVCTQWGFLMTPPPDPSRPRIISKLLTEEYSALACKLSYLPGEHFKVPERPDVQSVNKLGGFDIAADRLALIDGEADPWRGDCPHSPDPRAHPRRDTTLRPFKLIPNAVHHWDENGLANPDDEPAFIQEIHQQEIAFVKAWLKDFKRPKAGEV